MTPKRYCFLCRGELSETSTGPLICGGKGKEYDGCGLLYGGDRPGIEEEEESIQEMIEGLVTRVMNRVIEEASAQRGTRRGR